MSYSVSIINPDTGAILEAPIPLDLRGANYVVGGTTELELTITYNYHEHLQTALGVLGLDGLDGLAAHETWTLILAGIAVLDNDVVDDYWAATEGNAKLALINLLIMACVSPEGGVWQVQ